MNKAFNRLHGRKFWDKAFHGFIKNIEITKQKSSDNMCLPIIHVLIFAKPSYFSNNYVSHERWKELWNDCYRTGEDDPRLSINSKVIVGNKKKKITHNDPLLLEKDGLLFSVLEKIKSDTEYDHFFDSIDWFMGYVIEIYKCRMISTGGIFSKLINFEEY